MTARAQSKPVGCSVWWPESISDGGAHRGELQPSDEVHAVCGAVFVPLTNPYTGRIAWWHAPVDEQHACPACRSAAG